ncbi:MAG TPA: hypothetical protein VG370_19650 [Chloroflexota bacterium]|nr:hypothetical protein [Chloroflexota bacterium]
MSGGDVPRLGLREAYCPGHFGNSYEVMWPREMAAYLAELRHWGFNRYSDWLDGADTCDPYTAGRSWTPNMVRYLWNLPMELLARKKAAFRAATDLGLGVNLIVTPNHVFVDQLKPELLAEISDRTLGQLICPSKPEARAIILENHDRLFRDLAENGVEVASITAGAYDFGGCACDRCNPWIVTWAELVREVHDLARRRFPEVEPWLLTWWWQEDDYRLFGEWVERKTPGWTRAMVFQIQYGQTRMDEGPVPAGCRKIAFVHIGYGDVAGDVDLYAKYGAPVAAKRLPETVAAIAAQGGVGFQAYSEGVFDDVNKAILGALSSGRARTADEALREYAGRYFGANAEDAAEWARWLAGLGVRGQIELAAAQATFQRLAPRAAPGWRLEQLRSKLALEELDRQIAAGGDGWDDRRFALVDAFLAEQERLNRRVYGLGPVRYVIALRTIVPSWYASWRRAIGATDPAVVSAVSPPQAMAGPRSARPAEQA